MRFCLFEVRKLSFRISCSEPVFADFAWPVCAPILSHEQVQHSSYLSPIDNLCFLVDVPCFLRGAGFQLRLEPVRCLLVFARRLRDT